MPAPEQQKEYTRLSGKLQAIGRHFYKELPSGTTSLRMKLKDGAVMIEAYDRSGKLIGIVLSGEMSGAFRTALQIAFKDLESPDLDGVICLL